MNENKQSIAIGQAVNEHDSTLRAKRVVSPSLATLIDDVTTAGVTYVGKAAIASSAASAVWQVKKIDESGSPVTTVITWADGNDNFDNVWNNRASLTYL